MDERVIGAIGDIDEEENERINKILEKDIFFNQKKIIYRKTRDFPLNSVFAGEDYFVCERVFENPSFFENFLNCSKSQNWWQKKGSNFEAQKMEKFFFVIKNQVIFKNFFSFSTTQKISSIFLSRLLTSKRCVNCYPD